jgi:hypothetical protein
MVHSGLIISHEPGYSGHNRPPETFLINDFPHSYPNKVHLSIMSLSLYAMLYAQSLYVYLTSKHHDVIVNYEPVPLYIYAHLTSKHHDVMVLVKLWRYNYDYTIETFNHIFRPSAASGFTNKSLGDIKINVGNNQ